MPNIVELLRESAVNSLFRPKTFSHVFPDWKSEIERFAPASSRTARQVIDLGDHLSEIFSLTGMPGRSQSDVSGAGTAWEALICWYLNLCSIGRRTVIIKHNKALIPACVSDAITVNYGSFVSNTESDLIAITFPDREEYRCDAEDIRILDENGHLVDPRGRTNYRLFEVLSALCHRDFSDLEIHVIQCKTNWNDNAQVPMLWDMIYSARAFRTGITIGRNNYSIQDVRHFTYSFVTVPTSGRSSQIKASSTCVKRVMNLSGGNYWGRPTQHSVASSVKEMLQRNLASCNGRNHLTVLADELPRLSTDYAYFRI